MDKEKGDQMRRFIEAAHEAGADEDPEAFKERLKNLVKRPPPKRAKAKKPSNK
jgi:hypothetical protein